MPIPSEQEPRRQFQKSPEGTYNFLEQYSGAWDIPEGKSWGGMPPFLAIWKEEICEETGGSCMVFCLKKNEGEDLFVIQGHITDNDEIAFLYGDIVKRGEGIPHIFSQEPDINTVMSEIRAIVPPPEQH